MRGQGRRGSAAGANLLHPDEGPAPPPPSLLSRWPNSGHTPERPQSKASVKGLRRRRGARVGGNGPGRGPGPGGAPAGGARPSRRRAAPGSAASRCAAPSTPPPLPPLPRPQSARAGPRTWRRGESRTPVGGSPRPPEAGFLTHATLAGGKVRFTDGRGWMTGR